MRSVPATRIRMWAELAVRRLREECERVNRLNIFPIPDQDTGTNLLLTTESGLNSLLEALTPHSGDRDRSDSAEHALATLAQGMLLGSRGNSGVILSQIFRGLAEAAKVGQPDAIWLCDGLRRAREYALASISHPVDGTMLSVLRSAELAGTQTHTEDLRELSVELVNAMSAALTHTPRQLPVLRDAGIVDAGGLGLVLVFDALAQALDPDRYHNISIEAWTLPEGSSIPTNQSHYHYEVMYLLDGLVDVERLRDRLAQFGDCVSIAGDGNGLWTVHAHCDDIGAVIEAGLAIGQPRDIRVLPLKYPPSSTPDRPHMIAVIDTESGIADLIQAAGATFHRLADAHSTDDIIQLVIKTDAVQVTLFPAVGLRKIVDSAVDQLTEAGHNVAVIPTDSPAQILAALAVHDPDRRIADDIIAMAEAAGATQWGQLRIAEQEAITWAGRCYPGDTLGIVAGEVIFIDPINSTESTELGSVKRLIDQTLASGGELVTIMLGMGAAIELKDQLAEHIRLRNPEVAVSIYFTEIPDCLITIGIE